MAARRPAGGRSGSVNRAARGRRLPPAQLARLTNVDPGFRTRARPIARRATEHDVIADQHRIGFFTRLLEELDALPDVTAAGMTQTLPMRGTTIYLRRIQGRPEPQPNKGVRQLCTSSSSPQYFQTMGIPLLSGRPLTNRDRAGAPQGGAWYRPRPSSIATSTRSPISQGIDIGNGTDGFYEIVGVVGNVRDASLIGHPARQCPCP